MAQRAPLQLPSRRLDVFGSVIFTSASGLHGRGVGGFADMRIDDLSMVEFRGFEISETGPTWFVRPISIDGREEGEFVGLVMPAKDNAGRPGIFGVGVAVSDLPEKPTDVAMATMLQSIGVFFEDVRRAALTASNEISQSAFDFYDLAAAPRVTRTARLSSLVKGAAQAEYISLARKDAEDMLGMLIWSAPHMRRARGAPVFIGEDVGEKEGRLKRNPMDLLPGIMRAASVAKAEAVSAQRGMIDLQRRLDEAVSSRQDLEQVVLRVRDEAGAAQQALEETRQRAHDDANRSANIEAELRVALSRAENEVHANQAMLQQARRDLEAVRAAGHSWEEFAKKIHQEFEDLLNSVGELPPTVTLPHAPPPIPAPPAEPRKNADLHSAPWNVLAVVIIVVVSVVVAVTAWEVLREVNQREGGSNLFHELTQRVSEAFAQN